MNRALRILSALSLWLLPFSASAQDSTAVEKPKRAGLNGYVKDMVTLTHLGAADTVQLSNLIHNRFNFWCKPGADWQVNVSLRTRLFAGDVVSDTPGFAEAMDRDSGLVDLSFVPLKGRGILLHTQIDRANVRWRHQKWELTAGRQRINWGINSVWNPNDLFNTFSYIDFDYEERPGSDALRLQYYATGLSVVEVAVKPGLTAAQTVAAGCYRFNKKGYDLQLIGGWYRGDIALGGGWAGNLKNWGFKGEATWFQPAAHVTDSLGAAVLAVAVDRMFAKWYFHSSLLLNSSGADRLGGLLNLTGLSLSPKSLSPFRYTAFVQASVPLGQLARLDVAAMVNPLDGSLFLIPSFQFSLRNNLDLLLLGQTFFGNAGAGWQPLFQSAFLRLKWSF